MEVRSRKCNKSSERFLNDAIDLCKKSRHFEAIVFINKSLCYAPVGSSNIFKAYNKRSEIYFELEKYQLSLDNIELALQNSAVTTEDLIFKTRQKDCKLLIGKLKDTEDPWNFFKLSHQPHETIQFISKYLKLHETWKFGRCIITSKNLEPGDVVAIEEPLFKMLNKDARYARCSNCFVSNSMSLIPCQGTCTSTMFCSKRCFTLAWKRFHKNECSAVDRSLENDNEYDIMILKVILESLDICGGLEQLKKNFTELKPNSTIFNLCVKNTETGCQHEVNLLKAVFSLKKGPSSAEDLAMAEWIVNEHPDLKSIWKTKSQQEFLKNFVIKLMGIIDRNSYILTCPSMKSFVVEEEVGSGIYPFASLINHSCSPNLYRVFVDSKQVFIVKKPVEAGQQLFVGYQSNFAVLPREQRQEFLLREFQFKCSCEACSANYPLMKNLSKHDCNFKAPPTKVANMNDAVKAFKENCLFVKTSIETFPFPCYETCYVMQNSFRHLQFIAAQK